MKTLYLKLLKVTIFSLLMLQAFSCGNRNHHSREEVILRKDYDKNIEIEANKETNLPVDLEIEKEEETINPDIDSSAEAYDYIEENNFLTATKSPLSTFSIDVDNASYSNIKRFIKHGQKPPTGAVRIEEMINYFNYEYKNPTGDIPFSMQTEVSSCPWNTKNQLLKIGIQGKKIDYKDLKPSNLVFLIDVSGSMSDKNKLPLLIKSFQLMVKQLPENSNVSILTYAGTNRIVLEPTNIKHQAKILKALNKLTSGGGTAGANGIITAYQLAKKQFITHGNNRIILATDGDFNIGSSSNSELIDLIIEKRKQGIYLTVCGFGMGNYNDSMMEQISNYGNGNYFYINSYKEAVKVFEKELVANLFTIAKDVKIQVEFNPNLVKSYRLIGYENRKLNDEDFIDDTKDAGELGAGHNVTALYEIVPNSSKVKATKLKYQNIEINSNHNDLATLKLRYKPLNSNKSKLIIHAVQKEYTNFKSASIDLQFSSAVAGFGMLLRKSKHGNGITSDAVIQWAKQSKGKDEEGYRAEFIQLVKQFKSM